MCEACARRTLELDPSSPFGHFAQGTLEYVRGDRQRAAAALELAIRYPDQPLFNVKAPARRQKKRLGLR